MGTKWNPASGFPGRHTFRKGKPGAGEIESGLGSERKEMEGALSPWGELAPEQR
ncbi:MAG: hypothetical protein RBS73_11285 [Prolixibacteraceae bacterium]|nr:hypothetical protein [Prolixibacteraceae bacterium]